MMRGQTASKESRNHYLLSMVFGASVLALSCAQDSQLDSVDSKTETLSIADVHRTLAPGDRGAEVEAVSAYLKDIGYFPNASLATQYAEWTPIVERAPQDEAVYGPELEQAITAFQSRRGLPVNGRVDRSTLERLQAARCGVPDSGERKSDPNWKWAPKDVDANGIPLKWNKSTVLFKITGSAPANAAAALGKALVTWSNAGTLRALATTGSTFDVEIKFWNRGSPPLGSAWTIGNGSQVDFANAGLAGQVFAPGIPKTRIGINLLATADLQTTLLHEIGHILGLGHSSVFNTDLSPVMDPDASMSTRTVLSQDDKRSYGLLYNLWNLKDGVGRDIASGGPAESPKVYAQSNGNTLFFRSNNQWVWIPGNVAAIAVDDAGVPWAVSADHKIWKGNGSNPLAANFAWIDMTFGANANDIAASGGKVWIVSNAAAPNSPGNFLIKTLVNNNTWDASNGGVGARIAVDFKGQPWVVQKDGPVWRRYGSGETMSDPPSPNSSWRVIRQLDDPRAPRRNELACAKDIGAGRDHSVWIIGCAPIGNDFDIWIWNEQKSLRDETTLEAEFRPLDGFASRITGSPDGRPWVVQANGNIFQRAAFAGQL